MTAFNRFRGVVLALALLAPLAWSLPASAQQESGRVLDIARAMEVVTERFFGQIVAARLATAAPELGVPIVFEFRLLTPAGDILRIGVDPFTREIVDVDGHGLVAARKPVEP